MLTLVNMMTSSRVELGLVERLSRLKGTDPAACVPKYADASGDIARSPRFSRALARARALADERRLMAAAMLRRQPELCACEIQAALGVTHATVSHHMRILEDAGIVVTERRGKWMFYRLQDDGGVKIP
jgi:ArsR family transcriptional regulator